MPSRRAYSSNAGDVLGAGESLLVPIDARMRDVGQAPDGSTYLAIERDTQLGPRSTRQSPTGSVLRIDPAD